MTIAESADAWVPGDTQRAALAARDGGVELYLELGTMDPEALRSAIEAVVAECPVLHSVFRVEDTGVPRVRETAPAPVGALVADGPDPDRFVSAWIAEERSRAMDIARGPLHRQVVIRFADGRVGWYQRYHHLVNDEPGALAIVARVREVLEGVRTDPPPTAPFGATADRLDGERRYRESGAWAPDRAFWEQSLADAARPAPLPAALPGPAGSGELWSEVTASADLTRIARSCGGGAAAVIGAALAVYATRSTSTDEYVIGVSDGENPVPLRIPVSPHANFDSIAKQAGLALRRARRHRYLPDIDEPWPGAPVHGQWPLAVRVLGGGAVRQLSGSPVTASFGRGHGFTVCVDDRAASGWQLAVATAHPTHRHAFTRLLDRLARNPRTPVGRIGSAGPDDMEPLAGPRTPVGPIGSAGSGDIEHLAGSRARLADLLPTTLADLLAQQVSRTPDSVALVASTRTVSYADLHAASNRLARILIRLGAAPERLVAVAMDPSVEQIVAVHAILATGAAYVPLDPAHPRNRHAHQLAITRPICILTTRRDRFDPPPGPPVLSIDGLGLPSSSPTPTDEADRLAPPPESTVRPDAFDLPAGSPALAAVGDRFAPSSESTLRPDALDLPAGSPALAAAGDRLRPSSDSAVLHLDLSGESATPVTDAERIAPLRPENLAYVLFTSGSTGRPKGVGVPHAAVCAHLAWMQHVHGLDGTDVVLRKTALSFDVSAWEVLWPFVSGARVVVGASGAYREPLELARAVAENEVTTVQFTPSTFVAHRRAVAEPLPPSVRRVLVAGEALTSAVARDLSAAAPDARLDNLYGPTEATVAVTRHEIGGDHRGAIPIGAPGGDTRAYVLDSCLHPVAAGLPGELYLGGTALARGYTERPGPTAARFVADPFGEPGGRLYRTGDIVRSTGHGELEYLGRTDFQVKLRGIRIELGEIEAVLAEQEQVDRAVVVVRATAGSERLVAYVTAAAGHHLDPEALERRLRETLPGHLVPSRIVVLDEFPLNRSGKVDRAALPEPAAEPVAFRAPGTATERTLAGVFAEVLGRDTVGVDESFFALGGDSIMSILLVSRARSRGIAVTAQQVYEHRTVARLAAVAAVADGDAPRLAEPPGGGVGDLPLTPVIRFLVERGSDFGRFCQSLTLELPDGIDRAAMVSTITAVVDQHDMLRSRLYRDATGEWRLTVAPPGSVDVDTLIDHVVHDDLTGAELTAFATAELNAAVDRIDPATGAVLRFVWLTPRSTRSPGLLIVAAHHIAVDGVSWRVLLPDFVAAWAAVSAGAAPVLPAVGTSMRAWAHALVEAARDGDRSAELPVWRSIVEGPAPAFGDRPFDPSRDLAANVAHTAIELDERDTAALLTAIPGRYRARVADALLTALALAVVRWRSRRGIGERSVLLRLEGHGREQDAVPGADLSRTVGWFTSIVPARLDLTGVDLDDAFAGGPAVGDALRAVKEQLRAVPHNGFGYGLLRYLNEETAARLPREEPGEISFNYFGHITGVDIPAELSGLGWLPSPEFGTLPIRPDARRGALGAVEVDSIVLGDRLRTSIGYARTLFDEAAGGELIGLWREALVAVARHARDPRTRGGHTPSDFPLVTVTQGDIETWERRYPALTEVWPVSPLQAGMMFHALFDPRAVDVYTVQLVLTLDGTVDADRLRSAAAAVLERHPNLRTAFTVDASGAPVQLVLADAVLPWRELDLVESPDGAHERVLDAERATPFDLARPPLLQFLLARLGGGRTQLVVTYHHLLLDGWSIPLLLRELVAGYAGAVLDPPRPYRHYVEWLARHDVTDSVRAWADALSGVSEPTLLAGDARARTASVLPSEHEFVVDAARTQRLSRLAAELEITMNTLLQAAWAILLARLTDRTDIVFGTTVSGRPAELADVESMVGLFINTVPVRVRTEPGEPVRALLRRIQREQFELAPHQHVGLPDILAAVPGRAVGERGLFDTLLVVESYPFDAARLRANAATSAGLGIAGLRSREATHYALTLTARQSDRLHLLTSRRPDLLAESTAARLGERLERILLAIAANPDAAVADLDPLGAHERQLLESWQRPARPVPATTLAALFETQAAARPDAVAVRHGSRTLTYRDLDRASAALSRVLAVAGVGAESLVAVGISRSAELIVAILGVLRAGAAYVPLDLANPARRLEFVLAETNPAAVVTTTADRAALPEGDRPILLLDNLGEATDAACAVPDPDNVAYVLYTSGSTGRPKGVSVTHRNVVAMLTATRALLDIGPTDVWTMFHSHAFDFSVWEMWGALASGGTLVVVDHGRTRSPAEFGELLERERVTVLSQTPSAFYTLLGQEATGSALRHVVLGGEALDLRRLRAWYDARPANGPRLSNLYGITEATVHATHLAVDPATAGAARGSLVGRGLPGTTVRVLDSRLRPAPVGAPGEIYLAGDQLARGYHARPAATASRYVADPFGAPGTRLYRTGDLARWTADGQLEYLGRGDDQVKIRGYRIEPAEIEAALLEHDAVAQAAVVARAGAGVSRLVAYVVSDELAPGVLDDHVAQRLPEYMRPAAIVPLDALPLTAHGKLDRAALPDPVFRPRSAQAPRTPAERVVADVFAEVLGIDRPGPDDSFFALGGDSITSIQLATRARAAGLHLTPREIFEHRTVAGIAAAARTSADEPAARLAELPGGGVGELPLPPAVRWLTERGGSFRRVNQSLTIELPAGIGHDTLVAAVTALIDRHDMLRSRLSRDGAGEWRLDTAPPGTIAAAELVRVCEITEHTAESVAAAEFDAALDRLDPAAGVVVRFVRLVSGDPGVPDRLIICAHHIAVDGVSWRILIPDFFTALAAVTEGAVPQWDPPGTSMRRWAHALVDAAHAPDRIAELGLWRRLCATPDPLLGHRPLDPDVDVAARTSTVAVTVDDAVTDTLTRVVPGLFHAGVDEILVCGLAVALTRWRARRGVHAPVTLLRLEGHGREEQLAPGADLSRTVGWCTSLYPVRLDLTGFDVEAAHAGSDAAGAVLKAVKEQLRAIPDHGIGYGLLRYLNPDTAEQLPGPMPGQVAFNYLGRVDDRGAGVLAAPTGAADPDLPAAATLDVNAIITGTRLHAGFTYPATLLDAADVSELADLWVTALGALAAHAGTPHAGGHTPSDFPLTPVAGADIIRWERDYGRLTDVWPPAPLQAGLYFHAVLADPARTGHGAIDVYNVQAILRIGGPVDRDRLRRAAYEMLRRYPNLRAAFVPDSSGAPRQVVPETVELPWYETEPATEADLAELVAGERARRFDLAAPPLLRFTLARVAGADHVLIATYHHILLDGWSVPLVLRDLLALYASDDPLPPPGASFRSYLAWNHHRDSAASAAAWRRALDGVTAPTLIAPAARGRTLTGTAEYRWALDPGATAALTATAADLGVTVNTMVQAAWAVLVGRRCDRTDVVFGATVSGRPAELPGVESIVGLCINTVPVRVRFDPGLPMATLVCAVQAEQADLIEHHHLGLTDIHAAAGQRDLLFDTVLVYESYPIDTAGLAAAAATLNGGTGTRIELHDATHYPLTLTIDPSAALRIRFGYLPEVFDERQIAAIGADLRALLTALARDPRTAVEALP
ncbi:non-ribosomal peptide synthetase [Nocardia wallacei]|uniref:non-ribosomal peptide synthetase n=1 Tax=Nocardia wallacei TaxID=480035 RepID=UPI0024578AD3|nr:non-ribosomal peptide synthetase [Nocardia wallacei]